MATHSTGADLSGQHPHRTQDPTHGKLHIYLGAAPGGVGKTFVMLQEARRRKAEGVDIVVG